MKKSKAKTKRRKSIPLRSRTTISKKHKKKSEAQIRRERISKRQRYLLELRNRTKVRRIRRTLVKELRKKKVTFEEDKEARKYVREQKKIRVHRQSKRKRKQQIQILVKTVWRKQVAGKTGKAKITKIHNKKKNIYTRHINRGAKKTITKYQYIKIPVSALTRDSIKSIVQKSIEKSYRNFQGSTFDSFSASTQIIRGALTDKFTGQLAEDASATKNAVFPGLNVKALEVKYQENRVPSIETIIENEFENRLTDIADDLYYIEEIGFSDSSET